MRREQMKRIFLLLMLGVFSVFTTLNAATTITLNSGTLKVNTKTLSTPWTFAQFKNALGKSDRVFDGYNTIHTYDDKGIILYQTPDTETVSAFNAYYGKENHDFSPSGRYDGSIKIENTEITKYMTISAIKRKLPKYNFVESYASTIFRGEYKGVYVFVQYNDAIDEITYVNFGFTEDSDGVSSSGDTDINLSGGILKIGGKNITAPWTVSSFKNILGTRDSLSSGYNDIHTYDDEGIILYQTSGTETVSAFNAYFSEDDVKHMPASLYGGTITIEGITITKDMTISDIRRKLPDYNFKESYMSTIFRGEYKHMYVFVQYNDSKSRIKYVNFGYVEDYYKNKKKNRNNNSGSKGRTGLK